MKRKHIRLFGLSVCVAMLLPTMAQPESLYKEAQFRPLTADQKAFKTGDIVTIQVFEQTSVQATADTDTRRDNQVGAQFKPIAGNGKSLGLSTQGDGQGARPSAATGCSPPSRFRSPSDFLVAICACRANRP